MKRIGTLLLFLASLVALNVSAQSPCKWTVKFVDSPTPVKSIVFTAQLKPTWHLYDFKQSGGPMPLTINFDKLSGAKLQGAPKASKAFKKGFDEDFNTDIFFYEGSVTFTQKLEVTDRDKFVAEGYIKGQACSEVVGNCEVVQSEFSFNKNNVAATSKVAQSDPASTQAQDDVAIAETAAAEDTIAPAVAADSSTESIAEKLGSESKLWQPVIQELKDYGDATLHQASSSLWFIFISGFLYGFIALVTPCVWPMIPMTVSFFLKRTKSRKKAIKDALIYGFSIIVIYLLLGIVISLIFGPSALNGMATNAVFNIIFFLLLIFFAVSFFGAFELVLPSKWTNKMDAKADATTGLLSIFFMAFTLTLVSFSCTGPIIGTLLVQVATTNNIIGPVVGLFGFALSLALPFTLFAIFPNMLQSMPKSGGWLNSVKVVLAFLELALSLKFLSVADLAYGWHILDREVFLSLWIVIFTCLGLYLLGKIRFPHDSELKTVSVTRYFLATISLAFAVYMVPGLWGAPLKAISAFAPPLNTQDFSLYDGELHAKFDNYEEGMAYAKQNNKPVLLDFSGFGCVNCRKMENAVWIDPTVRDILDKDYVLITLMVDDKKPLPEVFTVTDQDGNQKKLRTVGDKWSYLQSSKFGATSQPFYVPLDPNGMPLGPSRSYNEDVSAYIDFLKAGLKEFDARKN
ncbi:protein-disulfide reductase DsbD family protein [Falsiporphyromonas endometrii]|uniref:Protein-disulfide reductase DsbD family protein n=1 Tax=Falsiporphyromonas endometrii TaxID=1387297 RepID=A0ABV9K7E8_9PORP